MPDVAGCLAKLISWRNDSLGCQRGLRGLQRDAKKKTVKRGDRCLTLVSERSLIPFFLPLKTVSYKMRFPVIGWVNTPKPLSQRGAIHCDLVTCLWGKWAEKARKRLREAVFEAACSSRSSWDQPEKNIFVLIISDSCKYLLYISDTPTEFRRNSVLVTHTIQSRAISASCRFFDG